jgi:hypothetical protein
LAYHWPTGRGGLTGGVGGERRRRSRGGAAAEAQIPAEIGVGLVNVLHGELYCGLGKMLERWKSAGSRRSREFAGGCSAAAAGRVTPASWRLSLVNKRNRELQGGPRESSASRIGDESGRRKGFPMGTKGGGNGGSTALCTRAWRTAASFYSQAQGGGEVFLRDKAAGSWHGHEAVRPRQPMVACGRRGRPMADGGATGRRMRAQRVARIWGPQYHAQERLGTADGPIVAGLPRRACMVAYDHEADVAERDVVRAHVPACSGATRFRVALFRRAFLKILQQKWTKRLIGKL